jgi:hypothetical protein
MVASSGSFRCIQITTRHTDDRAPNQSVSPRSSRSTMFERYTDRARRVIFFARYDASALASSSIDTEHLLLGLLCEGAGIAGKIFKRNKLTYEVVRREIEARGRLQAPTSTNVDMPLSPEAKLVLQHASEEAERMDASHIDTEHLLLAACRFPATTRRPPRGVPRLRLLPGSHPRGSRPPRREVGCDLLPGWARGGRGVLGVRSGRRRICSGSLARPTRSAEE